jgi:hypothetical protein
MRLPWLILIASALVLSGAAHSQVHSTQAGSPGASTSVDPHSEVARVPGLSSLLRGLNGGLTLFGVHDAGTGWSTAVQPAIGYSFNDTFALDVTIPVYMYRLSQNQAANPKPNQLLLPRRAELGDTVVGFHSQVQMKQVQYEATLTATVPTGDSLNGLSTGRATFDLSNLLQHGFRRITPSLELGIGDSTTLVNPRITRNYTSLGPLAHFQLGASVPMPRGASFQTTLYELLPIGDQKIYQSTTRKGTTTYVVTGHNVTEDNGFTNSLDVPVDPHTTLSAYYSRSLRLHDDIVSISISYVLRGARPATQAADDDIILRSIPQTAPARPGQTPAPAPALDELPPSIEVPSAEWPSES